MAIQIPLMSSFNLSRPRSPQINPATTSGGMSRGGVQIPYGTPIVRTNYSTPGTYNAVSKTYNPGEILGAATANNPASSGGGGGGGGSSQTSSGPSPEELQRQQAELQQQQLTAELDAIFNPVMSALSGQEETLKSNYASVPGEIQSQYNVSAGNLAQQKTSGMTQLQNQEQAAGERKEDALTSATRLYDELQRGGQQRFGGASSAGEAYQTLTAVEQQRRQGTIQSAYETAVQQVGQYKANLNEKYALALQDLEAQKNAALNDAQRSFRDALQTIQSAKYQAETDKATASMNLLQDLRNKIYTINAQNLQFAQQLALNQQMSQQQVDAYTQRVLQSITGGQTAVAGFNPQLSTQYGMVPGQTPTNTTQTGQIAGKRWDENTQSWV